jgi:hypothetical protein
MNKWLTTIALAFSVGAALLGCSHKQSAVESRGADTPSERFDAFQKAGENGDWRAVFFCLTPEAQDDAIFEAYFACNMRLNDAKVLALLQSFGVSSDVVDKKYYEQYELKHGMSTPDSQREGVPAPLSSGASNASAILGSEESPAHRAPPLDQDLYRNVVLSLIADKAKFYDAACGILQNGRTFPGRKNLRDLSITGDAATGIADTTMQHLESASGETPHEVQQQVAVKFYFRSVSGNWLIERMEQNARSRPSNLVLAALHGSSNVEDQDVRPGAHGDRHGLVGVRTHERPRFLSTPLRAWTRLWFVAARWAPLRRQAENHQHEGEQKTANGPRANHFGRHCDRISAAGMLAAPSRHPVSRPRLPPPHVQQAAIEMGHCLPWVARPLRQRLNHNDPNRERNSANNGAGKCVAE